MAKYGDQREAQSRRDVKAQVAEFEKSLIWKPDPSRETEESVESMYVGLTGSDKISQRTVRYKGTNQVIEFAVTYSKRSDNGTWQEVLCIDTCNHGTVHRHRDGDHSLEPEAIVAIESQAVLHDQLYEAINEVTNAVDWS